MIFPAMGHAGSCMAGDETFKACIEKKDAACVDLEVPCDKKSGEGCVAQGLKEALLCYPIYVLNEHPTSNPDFYMTPRAVRTIAKKRNNEEMRNWVKSYVAPILEKYPTVKCAAAFQMAVYQLDKAFDALSEKDCMDHWGLMLTGDEKAVPLFIEYFNEYDKKYRKKNLMAVPNKKFALGAFYIINSKRALPFLKEQLSNPRNTSIVPDIKKVIAHLEERP